MNYQNEEIVFYLNCKDIETEEEYFEKEFDNIELLYDFLESFDNLEFEDSLFENTPNGFTWSINVCVRDNNI